MQKLVCNIYFHECHLSLCSFIFWLSWSLSNSCSLLHPLPQRYAPDEDTQHIYDQTCRQLAAASALHPSLKVPAQGWLWWPDCPCCSAPHHRARAAPEASPQTPRDGGVGRALPEKIYFSGDFSDIRRGSGICTQILLPDKIFSFPSASGFCPTESFSQFVPSFSGKFPMLKGAV